ncbi:MAG: carboxylating nicotinate-nucleotide diphosphorylase [Desulfobacteraceae bacterium]|jgi:nicotinate-nucleotide pyrophosphorylase (carboxylating)
MIEDNISLDRIIRKALEEDLGTGDLTTEAIVDATSGGRALLLAREKLVLAGMPVFRRVFELLCSDMKIEYYFEDGQTVPSGEKICLLSGPLAAILKGERTALNFLQRMSGIATLTRSYVDKIDSQKVKLVDTRKTGPGIRLLDKYAVRMGGGFNHRFGLFDGVLIKDNHIAAAGSIRRAVSLAKKNAPHTVSIEVEVEDLAGVEEAIGAGADVILLDNMAPDMIRKAVDLVAGRVVIEASGGINLGNIEEIAQTGINIISVGALTHSPRAVDISLEVMI